jgi:hypothetical protein
LAADPLANGLSAAVGLADDGGLCPSGLSPGLLATGLSGAGGLLGWTAGFASFLASPSTRLKFSFFAFHFYEERRNNPYSGHLKHGSSREKKCAEFSTQHISTTEGAGSPNNNGSVYYVQYLFIQIPCCIEIL